MDTETTSDQLAAPSTMLTLENAFLRLSFDTAQGLALASLFDKSRNHHFLKNAIQPLFSMRIRDGQGKWHILSSQGFTISESTLTVDQQMLRIKLYNEAIGLAVSLRAKMESEQPVALLGLSLSNETDASLYVQLAFPSISGLQISEDSKRVQGMLPMGIGTTGPISTRPHFTGGWPDPNIGLPHSINCMEVAALYDQDGGGVFFAAAEPAASSLNLNLSVDSIYGFWARSIAPGQQLDVPRLAMGTITGDWHDAIDYYVSQHQALWRFPDTPKWLSGAGAIYASGGAGGGSIYMDLDFVNLDERINSFAELPKMFAEAQQMGCNILFLYDYWEGVKEGNRPPYWNKGDYIPRADMGGPAAFRKAIADIHAHGGRVILYVEPFIVFKYSQLGRSVGDYWGARDEAGNLYEHYPDNYTMSVTSRTWQHHIARVSQLLVWAYDVDGIFLDSLGWQWHWPARTNVEGELTSAAEWNQGVLDLIDEVRNCIQLFKDDAVVLCEHSNELMAQHHDGGLDATFVFNTVMNGDRILASPMRYAMPQVRYFSNGRNLNQLNQVFAAGHSLALSYYWLPHADYIRRLVQLREQYADALIYGKQSFQPGTGNEHVAAYYYEGRSSQIITIVNIWFEDYVGALTFQADQPNVTWIDLLTGEIFVPKQLDGGQVQIPVTMPPASLRILAKQT